MVDRDIIWAKISTMERHLDRVNTKRQVSLEEFLGDLDRQESILFNIKRFVL
jgi:hypothetical protein